MPNPLENVRGKAYFKQNWGDQSWIHIPWVLPKRARRAAAPDESSATLIFDYGNIKQYDTANFVVYSPKELLDYYVRINLVYPDDTEKPWWYGVVPRESKMALGGLSGGQQVFSAFGLEHVLDRVSVYGGWVENDTPNDNSFIDWFPGFNERQKRGMKAVEGNRSKNVSSTLDSYTFSAKWDATRWNNYEAALYLLATHAPLQPAMKWTFDPEGQYEALEYLEELHNPRERMSLWEWLKTLIDRRKGLSFSIFPDETESEIRIKVFSIVNQEVDVGGRVLPANTDQVEFNTFSSFPEKHLVKPIEIVRTALNIYTSVEALGERMVAIGTFTFTDQTLEEGWKVEDEQYFFQANEDARAGDLWDGFFTRFIVKRSWNRMFASILDAPCHETLNFICEDDGTVRVDAVGPIWKRRQRMERTMPIELGVDYSVFPPQEAGPNTTLNPKEYRDWTPIFAFVKLPNDVPGAGKWRLLDKLDADRTGLPSCHIRPLDRDFGFEITITPRHLFAKDRWPVAPNGALLNVLDPPRLGLGNLAVTAAVKCDAKIRCKRDIPGGNESNPKKLVIDVPGAEYWRAVRNCVVMIRDGNLRRIQSDHRVLRDDRDVVRGVAAFAAGWYSFERRSVEIHLNRPDDWTRLGAMLTRITGDYNEEVNTVVSAMECNFDTSEFKVETGWGNFDVVGAIVDEKKGIVSKRGRPDWSGDWSE